MPIPGVKSAFRELFNATGAYLFLQGPLYLRPHTRRLLSPISALKMQRILSVIFEEFWSALRKKGFQRNSVIKIRFDITILSQDELGYVFPN